MLCTLVSEEDEKDSSAEEDCSAAKDSGKSCAETEELDSGVTDDCPCD